MKPEPIKQFMEKISQVIDRGIDKITPFYSKVGKPVLFIIFLFIMAQFLSLDQIMASVGKGHTALTFVLTILVAITTMYLESLVVQKHANLGHAKFNWKTWPLILTSFVLIGIANLVASVISQIFYQRATSANQEGIKMIVVNHPQQLFLWGLIFIIFTPIIEELFYRGIVLNIFAEHLNIKYALPFSAIFFTLNHDYSNIWFFSVYALIGLACGYAYYKTKSLWTGIALHSLNNATSYVILLLSIYVKVK